MRRILLSSLLARLVSPFSRHLHDETRWTEGLACLPGGTGDAAGPQLVESRGLLGASGAAQYTPSSAAGEPLTTVAISPRLFGEGVAYAPAGSGGGGGGGSGALFMLTYEDGLVLQLAADGSLSVRMQRGAAAPRRCAHCRIS
jgi:glutamine cyclotransferase